MTLTDIESIGALDRAERTFQMDEEAFRGFYELTARPVWVYLARVTGEAAIEAGLQAYLVLTGSTSLESLGDYVYQPTQILNSVADLTNEIQSGQPSTRLDSPAFSARSLNGRKHRKRHQTDDLRHRKAYPQPALTA